MTPLRSFLFIFLLIDPRCRAFVQFRIPSRHEHCPAHPLYHRHPLQVSASLEDPPFNRCDEVSSLTIKLRQYSSSIQKADDATCMKPVRSFKRFIDGSSIVEMEDGLGDALCSSLIRSFRSCGQAGDYRMILALLKSAVTFVRGQPMLSPRVFGEAIDALSRTTASVSKLKQVWKLVQSSSGVLTEPVGAFELNVMLKALGHANKVHAALSLYRTTDDIEGDAFTASTLLNMLTASIRDNQGIADDWTADTPCWQYQEGMQVLRDFSNHLNNHVISSALKLNERSSQVFFESGRRHNGAKAALSLLGYMTAHKVTPDLVTCTLVLSAFDKHHEWKAAVAMLTSMQDETSYLPSPNVYAFSSVISACARCHEYNEAVQLLEQMRKGPTKPNTWVYNAVLSACVSPSKKNRNERIEMALQLLKDMERDAEEHGLETAPDTVSYNTALAAMEGVGSVFRDDKGRRVCEFSEASERDGAWVLTESLIPEMLEEMRSKRIPRDALTYHNAIKASKTNSGAIFDLLHDATSELRKKSSSLTGRAGDGLIFVYNAALSTLAQRGEMDLIVRGFRMMREAEIKPNHESVMHLVLALGRSRNSRNITTLLQALKGNQAAASVLRDLFGIDLSMVTGKSKHLEQLYAVAISSCLIAGDVESATSVLNLMKENGIAPSQSTMKEIAFAYTKLAVESASHQSSLQRRHNKYGKPSHVTRVAEQDARTHARRAGSIAQELRDPSPQLMAAVSSAYAVTGLFEEARIILQSLHEAVLNEQMDSNVLSRGEQDIVDVLPRLHRSLLKICAGCGNATSAFWYVEDIQSFANAVSDDSDEVRLADTPLVPDFSDPTECRDATLLWFNRTHTDTARKAGMSGEDWKLLLIAASKSGDWGLCLNTLQFLRPFLEATRPRRRRQNEEKLSRRYRKLARALTSSVLCFEARDQFAWAVRAIDDWIEWSGRRPPKEAVLTSIRILAKQGRGEEVTTLIQQVLQVKASASDSKAAAKHSYEEIIYIGAVTHLHNNGLTEEADELYLQAISSKHLPFSITTGKDGQHELDLHGMNVAIANSAVRIAFQQDMLQSETSSDLIIVTGRGMNSFYQMRPVIRPEIQRMLTEEFYPPLNTASMPGNMGALLVPAEDIQAWTIHQRQQRGVKMLAVADALKSLSSNILQRSFLKLSIGSKGSEGA